MTIAISPTLFIGATPISATELVAAFEKQGYDACPMPMLQVNALDPWQIEKGGRQNALVTKNQLDRLLAKQPGLIFTSRNSIASIGEALPALLHLPVFAVGAATAQQAQSAGFDQVHSGGGSGSATELARSIVEKLDPATQPLLHFSGRHIAMQMDKILQMASFSYHRILTYETDFAKDFSVEFISRRRARQPVIMLLFSKRGAQAYMQLCDRHKLKPASRFCQLIGVSRQCLQPVQNEKRGEAARYLHIAKSVQLKDLMMAVKAAYKIWQASSN